MIDQYRQRRRSGGAVGIVAHSPTPYLEVDDRGTVIEWSPSAERLLGWARAEVVGRSITETALPGDGGALTVSADGDDAPDLLLRHRSGRRLAAAAHVFVLGTPARPVLAAFLTLRDATSGGRAPAAVPDLVDALTGLPGRQQFAATVADALAATAGVHGSVAVVLLDVDRFAAVNNSMGHAVGDAVLVAVTDRIRAAGVRATALASMGGDTFLALFVDPGGCAHVLVEGFTATLATHLGRPVPVGGSELFLDVSAGVALNTFGTDAAPELLANAEAALVRAKRRGGSRVEVFGESLRIESVERMSTEHSLHRALERDELLLHYQPVVELAGVTTIGVEALLRWQHPDRGMVAPSRFVPVAEESGLIIPIGAWVLEQACAQLRTWHAAPGAGPGGCVEVNLSARQIDDARIVGTVEEILARTGLPPEHLTLEITESALMEDAAGALVVLRALKDLGVLLAIDDFGTGYSSLSYLQRFPLDVLKVDRMFVAALGADGQGVEIVGAVIKLAHALGLKVVAEGVETTVQLEVLRSLRCDYAQGFLFSRPVPADELLADFGLRASA